MVKKFLILLAFIYLFVSAPVQAGPEANGPQISGNVIFRLGYDGVYDAQSPLTESNDVFGIMIASPKISFGDRFSIDSEVRFEAVSPPFEDRFFENEGLFVRKLFATYRLNDQLSVQFGKLTPSYTLASLVTPGMFGNNYNKEIELIERIGIGFEYLFNNGRTGQHKLSFSTFFDDTTFLSDSIGSSRGPKDLSDGGSSNTEAFDSFAFSLEGSGIKALPGFTYKLGLLHQARGKDGVANEQGFLLAATRTYQFGYGKSLTWIGEIAPFRNFGGTNDDMNYTSAGLVYQSNPWTTVLSGTYRRRSLASGTTYSDYSLQTSIDYDFGRGVSLAFAHEFLRDQNVRSRRIGIRLSKVIEFNG